jgi:hypothetical protein
MIKTQKKGKKIENFILTLFKNQYDQLIASRITNGYQLVI